VLSTPSQRGGISHAVTTLDRAVPCNRGSLVDLGLQQPRVDLGTRSQGDIPDFSVTATSVACAAVVDLGPDGSEAARRQRTSTIAIGCVAVTAALKQAVPRVCGAHARSA